MISDLDLKIDVVIAYQLDLFGQVILFFADELDLFINIKEMVILNNPGQFFTPFLNADIIYGWSQCTFYFYTVITIWAELELYVAWAELIPDPSVVGCHYSTP